MRTYVALAHLGCTCLLQLHLPSWIAQLTSVANAHFSCACPRVAQLTLVANAHFSCTCPPGLPTSSELQIYLVARYTVVAHAHSSCTWSLGRTFDLSCKCPFQLHLPSELHNTLYLQICTLVALAHLGCTTILLVSIGEGFQEKTSLDCTLH